jgi:hypothetical protein
MSITGMIVWFGGAGGTFTFFSKFDDLVNKQTKDEMTGLPKHNVAQSIAARWPTVFNQLFSRIYGPRYISWRFVVASIITTLVVVVFLFILALLEGWVKFELQHHQRFLDFTYVDPTTLPLLLAAIIGYSIPMDFIGLLKSRAILEAISSKKAPAIILLPLDFAGSIVISAVGYALLSVAEDGSISLSDLIDYMQQYPGVVVYPAYFSPILWSTLTTSVWVVVFYVSMTTIRSSSKVLYFINRFFDVDKRPFSALGFAAATLISLTSVMAAIFSKL